MVTDLSRRDFVALSVGASLASVIRPTTAEPLPLVETDVAVSTADGTCDAVFIYQTPGSYPGVVVWADSLGLRPVFRDIGRRTAAEGYAVLVPNTYYRSARAPVFAPSFSLDNQRDREKYAETIKPFLAPGAVERDAAAFVTFLEAQPQFNRATKIGTQGYCLGGPMAIRMAAAIPDRVGAAVSFHGGFLATDKPDSPHLLAPRIRARLYVAIASDDDAREPRVKDTLRGALAASKVQAEIEVFPNALHGWCVPDSKAADNKVDADRAWAKLVALYKAALGD